MEQRSFVSHHIIHHIPPVFDRHRKKNKKTKKQKKIFWDFFLIRETVKYK